MKKYDREKRKWVDEKEVDKKLAKRKLCKGGREHDFILVLPSYIRTKNSILGIEQAEKYYQIELEIEELLAEKHKELEALGILHKPYSRITNKQYRSYICSVCKKHEYKEYIKNKIT